MLTYYVVYRNDERVEPAGIFVMDTATGDAILWNHRSRTWAYDPGLVVRFLDDYRNVDRYERVERSEAEELTERVTSGEALPDEETVRRLFRLANLERGEPT